MLGAGLAAVSGLSGGGVSRVLMCAAGHGSGADPVPWDGMEVGVSADLCRKDDIWQTLGFFWFGAFYLTVQCTPVQYSTVQYIVDTA